MSIITLLTDFGLKDGNVGVMKGVIWNFAPDAQIADLSHLIPPQNITEAALVIFRAPYFPIGAIHVVVVDPGVGTVRRPIAARVGMQYFVGPDNGFLTMVLERAEKEQAVIKIVSLDRKEFWLPEVSHVFHGRDIFAPIAGRLAAGMLLSELGSPITDPVRLHLPQPEKTSSGWSGEIIHVDHFGNLSTNIREEHLGRPRDVIIQLAGKEIHGLVTTFGDRPVGDLIALYGSTGNLIISVVNDSAAQLLGVKVGERVKAVVVTS